MLCKGTYKGTTPVNGMTEGTGKERHFFIRQRKSEAASYTPLVSRAFGTDGSVSNLT